FARVAGGVVEVAMDHPVEGGGELLAGAEGHCEVVVVGTAGDHLAIIPTRAVNVSTGKSGQIRVAGEVLVVGTVEVQSASPDGVIERLRGDDHAVVHM